MALSEFRFRALWSALMLAALVGVCAAVPSSAQEGGGDFVNLAVPAGGEVVVENRRGGVHVEVWDGEQVGLAVLVGTGAEAPKAAKPAAGRKGRRGKRAAPGSRLPVNVETAGGALKITVER
ncbi:MAG TPA: hypothetical protein VF521_20005, partial [Pyrinomonadaceae bacterium]